MANMSVGVKVLEVGRIKRHGWGRESSGLDIF